MKARRYHFLTTAKRATPHCLRHKPELPRHLPVAREGSGVGGVVVKKGLVRVVVREGGARWREGVEERGDEGDIL
ncbi:hypothetical protein E2C01_087495 [Portunus trituberculatus]|uniref:Uncharacterized protein n=1 Tax=Portunus trituberculatus TaxID=210409 RepID=A0A5B7JGH9_PORTR|nr:hypothetical protein [Portunus trituberculatus]